MGIAERRFRGSNKYKKRIKLFLQIWGEYARTAHVLKSTSTPCSCNMCKGNRYSRKQKHKQNGCVYQWLDSDADNIEAGSSILPVPTIYF